MKSICIVLAALLLVQTLPAAERQSLPNLDARTAPGRTTAAPDAANLAGRANGEARLKARLPRVVVERLPLTGSASWVADRDGFLTGPNGQGRAMEGAVAVPGLAANDPHRVVKSFVREHAAVFGHDHAALEKARITRDGTAAHNGVRSTTWEQQIAGIPIHRGSFTAHVSRNGELITVSSEFLAKPEDAAPAAQRQAVTAGTALPVTALRALSLSAQNLALAEPAQWQSVSGPEGGERIQKFTAPGWQGTTRVALIWLPMDATGVRLCWRVWMTEPARNLGYEIFLDAATGEVLKRRCVTEHAAAPATYRAFTTESPTPFSPGFINPTTNQPPTVSRSLINITSLDTTASPNGWVDVGLNQLRGNNANAYYMKATSESSWVGTQVNGNPSRVFDFPLDLTKSPETHPEAATVNAFYWVNWMHDKLYDLGFVETERNCQETNFNRGGLGGDSISVTVNSPSDEDNAGMTTWPEGTNPGLSLGIFTGPNPDRESAFDAEIVLHECAHALSNRMIGDGSGLDGDAVQSRGMGEGWSDFYAMALTSQSSDNLNGNYPKAAYSSFHLWGSDYEANYYSGIRRYPYTTDMAKNPLTFKDIDPDQANPHYGVPMNPVLVGSSAKEVHNVGEVWCSMLWEARARLIQKHGFNTGNQLILQLVTDGMRLSPNDPSFVTSRNAIILADNALTSGANVKELWAAFAKRGLGVQATAPVSTTTTGVKESFDSLDALNVLPTDGVSVAGPVGGPFVPSSKTYTLTNDSNASFVWGARAEPPLELGIASGTLAAHAKQSVIVTINAAAAGTLPAGAYAYSVFFTNQTSGLVLERVFSLVLGIDQMPTERFSGGDDDNDLAFRTLWYEPDATGTNYSLCRQIPSPLVFPVDPASAQTLDLSNSTKVVMTLTGGAKFPFFGQDYTELEVGRDGSIVPGAVEAPYSEYFGMYSHFAVPRIAAFRNSYSSSLGRVSWQQLADRAVFTWENVGPSAANTGSFQMELYFDGRIRVIYLASTIAAGIAGLSPGGGAPPFFVESDLSVSHSCTEPLLHLKAPAAVTEGGLVLQSMLVSVDGRAAISPIVINVTSSDTSEIQVPATVTIPAGETEAPINFTVVNDSIRDGTQVAFITVSRSGYTSASLPIRVHDNETAALTVSIPSTKTEGALLSFGTVTMSSPAGGLVGINLESSNPTVISVPPVVFIPAGQSSAIFYVTAPDNNRIEGSLPATVTASVANWSSGSDTTIVFDDESTNLTMFSSFLVSESSGTILNGSSIQISGVLTTNLPVILISDDESEIRTPLFGGFIPAGSTNVTLPLFIQDDASIDGLVIVRLRAIAGGFGPATNSVFVFDNDGPPEPFDPQPPHESVDVPLHTDLVWGRVEGELVVNGNFEAGTLKGWSIEGAGGGFVLNDASYDPQSSDGPLPPLAGSFSALADQAGGGTHVLYQDIYIPDGALNATLGWTDQIRNHGGPFSSTHRFRVEVRDTNDVVLATLFSTPANLPAFTGPTNRTADLKPWRGERIRLAFVEQDSLGFLNVHLDNISVLAPSASPTTFDVYFGNDTVPDATEYLGSTTNSSWPLLPLAGGLNYYWRIDTRRGGITNTGPTWHFTTVGSSLATVPMTFGSAWKYVATGVNLGTGWRSPSYNDVLWQTGIAPLGFGGSEVTTIGDSRDEFTTFYFRRRLTLLDTNRLATVTASLRRDDGAVVYVNGVEAFRDNMPGGTITYTTQASTVVTDGDETISQVHAIDPSLFIEGTNIIAVEVHQRDDRGGPSTDLYFDLAFTTRTNTGNMAPWLVSWITPGDFDVLRTPTNLLLRASVADDNLLGTKLEFFANGAKLGEDPITPFLLTWTNPPVGLHTLLAVATDSGGLSVTSAPRHVVVVPPTGTSLATMIPAGSSWLYLDTGNFPGSKWTALNYNDSRTIGWKSGSAQLGYGDGDEATVVSYGRSQIARNVTTWFRRHFTRSADLTSISMRVLRDDGVVVYLNGTEIFRNNLPGGTIGSNTLANVTVTGSAETSWIDVALNSQTILSLLNAGDNVLAAEVHQASANSPDMSFDLELTGIGNILPAVTLIAPANNSVYLAPSSLPLTATASDAYGSVGKVEFFRNGSSLGFITSPPYQLSWPSPPNGIHTLTAIATDNLGATKTSAPITVTIVPPVLIAAQLVDGSVELTWPLTASGYRVETAASLTPPILWQPLTNTVTHPNGFFRVLVDDAEAQRYFRLIAP